MDVRYGIYADVTRAELGRQALLHHGIEAEVRHASVALLGTAELTVELWGPADALEQAQAILDDAEDIDEGLIVAWSCRACGASNDASDARCTRCGGTERAVVARDLVEAEWRCPTCGETVPADFDACWKCQAARPGEAPLDVQKVTRSYDVPPERKQYERRNLPWMVLGTVGPFLLFMAIRACHS